MATGKSVWTSLFFIAVYFVPAILSANVVLNKIASANTTCGFPAEEFFSVLERLKKPRNRILSVCDATSSSLSHNASNLVDGLSATFWQSPASVDKVSITIDLRGEYQKFYYVDKVDIHFGEYYRPGQLAFYKSSDYGVTYQPWHRFVTMREECQEKFNVPVNTKPGSVDAVLCMPYTSEELEQDDLVSLEVVGPRGDVNSPSEQLLEWMNVTNIRLEFMSLRRIFDVLAVRWHHYAVREVEVDAYCLCNGQGNGLECFYNDTFGDNQCSCQAGACGIDCGICCPAYNQYPWQQGGKGPLIADENAACQHCNCHNHSSVCVYNGTVARMNMSLDIQGNYSGGGVCQQCQDNTEGINCEKCASFYYRPENKSQWDQDACHECNCSVRGSKNHTLSGVLYLDCLKDENTTPPYPGLEPGDCICKNNTMGRRCNLCKLGYYNLSAENPSGCQECTCHIPGTVNGTNICEPHGDSGLCPCKQNVMGTHCDTCKDTYYNLQQLNTYGCTECNCDIGGSVGPVCNKTSGQCVCKQNVGQRQCDSPQDQFYYPTLHFIRGRTSHIVPSGQGNKTWTTTVDIVRGVNSSGLFILLLSYTSTANVTVTITVNSNTVVTHVVYLDSCHGNICNVNLSAFEEVSLRDSVVVNITYRAEVTWFAPVNVVALPREFYQPTLLANSTMENFLANCSVIQNSMESEFCRSQVYSLTIDYLGEASSCDCDVTGSFNGTCVKYGGQCHCKAGVTGRKCDRCIAGFFNLTSEGCSACECQGDHKECDVMTGQCVCPPNTVGRVCDQCNNTFFGWNGTTGCQDCNCSMVGSENLQCNLTTGLCKCKPGVEGEKCTECMDGYKQFSNLGCSLCSCDGNGSLSEVCNKSSGQCPCKNNTVGLLCDKCEGGFFYLTSSNPKGCTNCVCMDISTNCSSTTRYRQQREVGLDLWSLGTADVAKSVAVSQVLDGEGRPVDMIGANTSTTETLYWRAHKNLTDMSLVDAYGGSFMFKLYFTQLVNGTLSVLQPKVILQGVRNISIEHNLTVVPADQVTLREVVMTEMSWVHSNDHSAVSRDEFLLVLARLQAVLITASFYTHGDGNYQTRLGAVQMASTGDTPSLAGRASDVEQCQCGPGYSGLSCERCARGHHRVNVSSDLYLGKCVPCNCNGHSNDCNPATGQCLNCDHNTTGFQCELCLDGFYGNASDGTPGDCKKCPCESPRTTTSLCQADGSGQPICLNCSEGYQGNICGSCMVGFFGEPLNPGGNCSRCQCNNNSAVCNSTTGECLNCQHNTTGFNCERCENGTWGNATEQQCQACVCDGLGAYHNVCNHVTGQCDCKPLVGELNCSRCEADSYNFTSAGCTPCECNVFGSNSSQCNESGICECNNNTLGEKCDLCEWGFFGLPNKTCQECGCNETGANNFSRCDRESGQCDCKPGVNSRICDVCMIQHTNFSGNGCDACPLCSRLGLQGDVDKTLTVLNKAKADADTVANLEDLWPELEKVEILTQQTKESAAEFDRLVTSLQHNITQLKNSTSNKTITDLQGLLSSISNQSRRLSGQLSEQLSRIQILSDKTQSTKDNLTAINTTVGEILIQLTNWKNGAEKLLQGVDELLNKSYESELERVERELESVQAAESLAVSARYNVSGHSNMSHSLNSTARQAEADLVVTQTELNTLRPRISTVAYNNTEVLTLVNETEILIRNGRNITGLADSLLRTVTAFVNTSAEHISYGRDTYQNASHYLSGSPGGLTEQVNTLNNSLTAVLPELSAANQSVVENATQHAANLTAEAKERQRVFNTTLSHGESAVKAIRAYEDVVQLGNQSLETSRQVNQSLQDIMSRLENITLVSSDLNTRVAASRDESEALLNNTLDRNTDMSGLRSNVTASNQTFWRAVSSGVRVDAQYSTLQSRRDALLLAAEVGSGQQHSLVLDADNANGWSAEARVRFEPVNSGAQAIIDQVNRLEQKMRFINQSAERAAVLLPQAFNTVRNASFSLGSVNSNIQQAEDLKTITTNLQQELRQNMTALEDKLRRMKAFVAKIRLALKVQGSTAVQYRPTARLVNKTTFTEISVDFNATRVQGSLFFLSEGSNPMDRSVSVTLEQGAYVRFSYDLGSGPIVIINWAVPVLPGRWYTAYATRYGRNGRLTVTDHSTNFSRTYDSDTALIAPVLYTDFTPDNRLYVGGLPDGPMINKTDRFFDGCIDNVVVNQQTLELWNPVKVEGNRSFCSRRPASPLETSPGTSFFGIPTGHVKQRMGHFNITGASEMEFEFRTFLDTSLVTSVLNGQNYVYGVYLNNSRVVFYFKAGNQTYTVRSSENSYSDGRWYKVHITRGLTNASLTVRPVGPSDSGGVDHSTISVPGPLFLHEGQALLFGGKDPNSPINVPVSSSFAGDLRYINISTFSSGALVPRPLNSANFTETSEGVDFSGTLLQVERGIRFLGQGYAAVETGVNSMNRLDITFKTLSPSGLLVYSGEGPFFYLALFHGNLYMIYSMNLTTFQPLTSRGQTLNDGAYHTIRVEAFEISTQVHLDGRLLPDPDPGLLKGPVPLNGSLFIGGVDDIVALPQVLPVIIPLKGDVRELLINGAAVNIFSGRSQRVSLAGVPPERGVVPTAEPTTPPPTLPPPTCGSPHPPLTNSSGQENARLGGADSYIAFNPSAEVLGYIRNRFVITLRFRSLVPNGLLLYAADDLQNPAHFISLELVSGRLVFKYNANYETVTVLSKFSNYSEGGFEYEVGLLRIAQFGAMLVVSNNDYSNSRQGDVKPELILNSPFYYGGVPSGINMSKLEGGGLGFIGCVGALEIQYTKPNTTGSTETEHFNPRMHRNASESSYDYKPCYQEVQAQAGFIGTSHILFDGDYSLPDETDIEISFRSTTRSGLLISITNSSGAPGLGSVTLEQLEGQVVLVFNTAEHNSSVIRWTDPSIPQDGQYNASFHLCDNKFHRVRVKWNLGNVTLTVDNHAAVQALLPFPFSLEHGRFYIGGVPDGSGSPADSGMSHQGLTGCVQGLIIDTEAQDIIRDTQLHEVQQGCNAPRAS